jgi:hypothetical protein
MKIIFLKKKCKKKKIEILFVYLFITHKKNTIAYGNKSTYN